MNASRDPSQTVSGVRDGARPAYVTEALQGLTRAQKRYVIDGCIHGDPALRTIRELQRKALFYLHIDSPNGRAGFLRLTPLGETVRAILKARRVAAADTADRSAKPREDQ